MYEVREPVLAASAIEPTERQRRLLSELCCEMVVAKPDIHDRRLISREIDRLLRIKKGKRA